MKQLNKITLTEEDMDFAVSEEVALQPLSETTEDEEGPIFPQLGKWLEKIHIKPFPWKMINARNAIIAGCLIIIAVAGYLNVRYGGEAPEEVIDPGQNTVSTAEEEDFFANAIIDRERARGEALEVLVNITEDESAGEEAVAQAFSQMERIANETSWEIDIENLVKAKGFEECVAVINADTANIVVQSDGLTAGQVAQIKEIVYLETEIHPKDVKIIEKTL